MKLHTITELRAKNTEDLDTHVKALEKTIKEQTFDKRTNEVKNVYERRAVRKQLAASLTILSERRNQPQKGKEK